MTALTADLIEARIGQAVTVVQDNGEIITLRVKRVRRAVPTPALDEDAEPLKEAFSIDLRGPVDPVLTSLTYPVTFDGLKTTHLFVSPYHRDDAETFYEILFA